MRFIASLLALCLPAAVQAQTLPPEMPTSGTNMPPDFYPRSPCIKPAKVEKDGTARTSSGSAQYWAPTDVNAEVAKFNKAALAFNACIKLYVDKARLDTQNILGVVNAATADVQGASISYASAGGGNMPAAFYPRSPCIQPVPPESPAAARDRQAALRRGATGSLQNDPRAEAYGLRVRTFNAQAAVFNVCRKTYVDSAKRDIEQIQSIVGSAVADANAPFADPAPKGDFMTKRRR